MTRPPIIEAAGGIKFNIEALTPEMFTLDDIAISLGNTCRFRGHVSRFYSVAEHAVRASRLVWQRGYRIEVALAALHHDSHEAYVGDTPTPFKGALLSERYQGLVGEIDYNIGKALGVNSGLFHSEPVKTADEDMLAIEADQLKASRGVGDHWGHRPQSEPTWDLGWTNTRATLEFARTHHWLAARCRPR